MTVKLYVMVMTCLALIHLGSTIRTSGPFDWIIEKLEKCPDSKSDDWLFPTRLSKVSRTKVTLSGLAGLTHAIDKNSMVYVDAQKMSSQGYRPRYLETRLRSCAQIWKHTKEVVIAWYGSAGVNVTGCPFPAGNFTIKDMEFSYPVLVPQMIYAKFRVLVTLYQSGKQMGCYSFYAETVPKQS